MPAFKPAAGFVKSNHPMVWLYAEVGIAWVASYQTYNDPNVWIEVE
jgi:hypothetical protein